MNGPVHISLADVEEARATLRTYLPLSPVIPLQDGVSRAGEIHVKAENLMPTGSFKIRGATYRLSRLTAAERQKGVVAYSTGNHAQAVAKAARDFDTEAMIVMSPDAAPWKIEATMAWGAKVVFAEANSDARRSKAEEIARSRDYVLVPPYDDLAIMTGQGTIGLELLEQFAAPDDFTLYVPIGGGGLIAGIAAVIKQKNPNIRIVGVEPVLENDAMRSFRSGRLTALALPSQSIADAIKVQRLGNLTWPLIRRYVDDILAVTESQIAGATLHCFDALKLVVEPGGAVGLAAALDQSRQQAGTHVALLCGGNIRLEELQSFRALAEQ